MMIIYPLILWIFDLVFSRELQILHYILSGLLVGILFVIILYFQDKRKEKRRTKER